MPREERVVPLTGVESAPKAPVSSSTVAAEAFGVRVEVNGGHAGHVTGVLVHPANGAIGLEVTSPEWTRRFLPLVAATLADGVIEVHSPLLLVESCDAYLARGATICRDVASAEELCAAAGDDVSKVLVVGTATG